MHYFHNFFCRLLGAKPSDPHRLHRWTQLGDFRFQTPNLPTPGKNPAGAHARWWFYVIINLNFIVYS